MMNPDSPKRLRERLKEATREAILSAAEQVIGVQGATAAKVEEIAREAGISVGTVYNHFEDRDALVRSLLEVRRQELIGRVDRALLESRQAPFETRLRRFIEAVVAHFQMHRALLETVMLDEGATGRPGGKRVVLKELTARADALVQSGIEQGALRVDHPEVTSMILVGGIRSLLMRRYLFEGAKDVATSIDALVDLFLNGAGRRP